MSERAGGRAGMGGNGREYVGALAPSSRRPNIHAFTSIFIRKQHTPGQLRDRVRAKGGQLKTLQISPSKPTPESGCGCLIGAMSSRIWLCLSYLFNLLSNVAVNILSVPCSLDSGCDCLMCAKFSQFWQRLSDLCHVLSKAV